MLTTLLESGAKRKRSRAGLAASIAIHGVLATGLLFAGTRAAARTLEKPKAENIEFVAAPKPEPKPEKVYKAPEPPKEKRKAAAPKRAPEPPRIKAPAAPRPAPVPANIAVNVPVITPPSSVPTSLPAIDPNALETTSDIVARASDVASGSGSGSGTDRTVSESSGDVGTSRSDGSAWGEEQVDRAVQPQGRMTPEYPASLRSAGVEGTVVLRFVVGANGRVEMNSIEVVDSPHPRFTDSVKSALRGMRYRAAEVRGTKVRQLVEQSFTFKLSR